VGRSGARTGVSHVVDISIDPRFILFLGVGVE
jgi:hypothetical protein